jgi:hypothetical protein
MIEKPSDRIKKALAQGRADALKEDSSIDMDKQVLSALMEAVICITELFDEVDENILDILATKENKQKAIHDT